jgi:endonuclease/exonuclease/phosphatase family metal-dependent hydrolase
MAFELVTWNVLHRIHAVNWQEPALAGHPDEAARIAAIAAWLAGRRDQVICLQEVSGDQLAAVRALAGISVFAMKYPRTPRYYRNFEPLQLTDPDEYLVTIVAGEGRGVGEATFPSDRGKGFLAVACAGAVVINTHVSFGDKHAAQCKQIVDAAADHAGRVVVCGDFNADRTTCLARFPAFVAAALPADARPTRPRASASEKSQNIDHVLVRGGKVAKADVLDGAGLSDHNPVVASIVA